MKPLCIGLVILLLNACSTLGPAPEDTVSHVVLVWFKASVTRAEIAEVRDRTLALRAIPGIRSLRVGSALPSRRPIVDDSFDLGVVMEFGSVAEMRTYLVHPDHKAFVEHYVKGRVERLLVYDIQSNR